MLNIHGQAPVARLTGRKAVVNVAAVARPAAAGRAGQQQSVGVASQVRAADGGRLQQASKAGADAAAAHTDCQAPSRPAAMSSAASSPGVCEHQQRQQQWLRVAGAQRKHVPSTQIGRAHV